MLLKVILADLLADLSPHPQMHHGIYIMGCIWQPFEILQGKVGISFYFWIIRLVNSQLALYSHVRFNHPWHPLTSPKHPPNDNYKFQLWGLIFAGLICNIVKGDLGRSAGRSTPPPQMHHGMYIMGCIWQPFEILQEKVGISFYFWIIRLVNSQLALYSHVRCNPPWHPQHPQNILKHSQITPTWQLQISTIRAHICQV